MDAFSGQPWLWIAANCVLGLPLALAILVVARESLRALLALALGFRVFEIHWGAGRPLFECPIGPVDFAIGPIPIAGSTIARSGYARRHQLARVVLALAPSVLQAAWLAGRMTLSPAPLAALETGPAVPALFDLANALLLAIHLVLPIELGGRTCTDARLFFDALLGPPESNRIARASYYARLARMRLERSDVDRARAALERGLVQLGREPLLVACTQRFEETELDSVVDQGDCAADLREIIEATEPVAERATAGSSFGQRAVRRAILATPMTLALATLLVSQVGALSDRIETGWQAKSGAIATAQDPAQCTDYLEDWIRWARLIDRWRTPSPATRSDRHLALALLERCRGDLTAATEHEGEAMLAANAARAELAQDLYAHPDRWLENELRMAGLFRHAATVEHERRAYREALLAITNGQQRLETVRRQLGLWSADGGQENALESVASEEAELLAMRTRVLASLSKR